MNNGLSENDFSILEKLDFNQPIIIINADIKLAQAVRKSILNNQAIIEKLKLTVETWTDLDNKDGTEMTFKVREFLNNILKTTYQLNGQGVKK